jgi:hypothetical protein
MNRLCFQPVAVIGRKKDGIEGHYYDLLGGKEIERVRFSVRYSHSPCHTFTLGTTPDYRFDQRQQSSDSGSHLSRLASDGEYACKVAKCGVILFCTN